MIFPQNIWVKSYNSPNSYKQKQSLTPTCQFKTDSPHCQQCASLIAKFIVSCEVYSSVVTRLTQPNKTLFVFSFFKPQQWLQLQELALFLFSIFTLNSTISLSLIPFPFEPGLEVLDCLSLL